MTQKIPDEREMREILELAKIAEQKMREATEIATVMSQKCERWYDAKSKAVK